MKRLTSMLPQSRAAITFAVFIVGSLITCAALATRTQLRLAPDWPKSAVALGVVAAVVILFEVAQRIDARTHKAIG